MDRSVKALDIVELYGSYVFNEKLMKQRLPKDTFKMLKNTLRKGEPLKPEVADVVASAMKDWAIENGATHYTHWFQPLTGLTAEKHDAFISPVSDGSVIQEFSGKQLTQGEPDASSFPSGGLRATFEARGYTIWDATSPAFLKEDAAGNKVLCIPTAFCSYTGFALDKKTPLLRSMNAVSKQALRLVKAIGNTTTTKITSTVGPEQEYFLVDKKYFAKREDLMLCGRTLFGSPSAKGQEMEDHYFGAIKDKVLAFMQDLDIELWKMGIASKTRHNEVAPAQFEMAPIFSTTNIATDHNQLVMETMRRVALRHDLVCLLHEKPYAGINGSGKHNNWSLGSDDGINFLEPGTTPHDNEQFLIFMSALIRAVDKHSDLLRASAASTGNDHRLGANEAPPAIISVFLGDELTETLLKIAKGDKANAKDTVFMQLGVDSLPGLPKDNSDRNRTSPFAFTGNKFEFRMVGSSASISDANIVLNLIVAETLDEFAARLEKAKDVNAEITSIVKEVINQHGRIIFNGNNYSEDWVKEAEKRGLPNIKSTIDAYKAFVTPKAVALFNKYQVLSGDELHSRYEIYVEQYAKEINIEALTAIDMVNKLYIPSVITYTNQLASSIGALKGVNGSTKVQEEKLQKISKLLEAANAKVNNLEMEVLKAKDITDIPEKAKFYRDAVFVTMKALREDIDNLEKITPKNLWPVPSYTDLLNII